MSVRKKNQRAADMWSQKGKGLLMRLQSVGGQVFCIDLIDYDSNHGHVTSIS